MSTMIEKIQELGVVPVVVLEDAKDALALGRALCEGSSPPSRETPT